MPPPRARSRLRGARSISFCFLESEDGFLNVLLRGAGGGDGMWASCVDWYGNSRPLFLRNRVFALLGYEIVEGSLSASGITEIRRINFAPHWLDSVP